MCAASIDDGSYKPRVDRLPYYREAGRGHAARRRAAARSPNKRLEARTPVQRGKGRVAQDTDDHEAAEGQAHHADARLQAAVGPGERLGAPAHGNGDDQSTGRPCRRRSRGRKRADVEDPARGARLSAVPARTTRAAEPARPCIMPTSRLRRGKPVRSHGRGRDRGGDLGMRTPALRHGSGRAGGPARRRGGEHVDVNPVAGEAVKQMPAEKHEHRADRHLEPAGERRADGALGQDDGAGEGAERRHVAEAPDDAVTQDAAPRAVARREAGQRRQVVGLHGVLQAQEKAEEAGLP